MCQSSRRPSRSIELPLSKTAIVAFDPCRFGSTRTSRRPGTKVPEVYHPIDERVPRLRQLPDPWAPAARCPAPAKRRRHVPNNMGPCPISIQVFFPYAPRSCEGMASPFVQAEARVRMPVTRRPRPRSVPSRGRRRATRGQRLQRFRAAVGASPARRREPARATRPRPRGRPPERARRAPAPSHTARRRWSSARRP